MARNQRGAVFPSPVVILSVLAVAIAAVADPAILPERAIAAAAAGGLLFAAALAYPRGMGLGDVKLAATMGLFLGRNVGPAILVALLAGSLVTILIAAIGWAAWVWLSLGSAEISTDGFIALALGIVVSLTVGVGLMILVFYSSRRGYDEQLEYDLGSDDKKS